MKQSDKKGKKNEIGAYGEQIAKNYVKSRGFNVISVNYLKKWGEIDIVARETSKNNTILHFIEVKTVSYETKTALDRAVSHGTWRPEENVTPEKITKLHRTIDSWLSEYNDASEWVIDIAAVRIVPRERYATVKYIDNVVL